MEYKWTVLTVTTLGVLMSGLDAAILIIGLPQLAFAMHADAEQAIWFTQGYVLSNTIMLLLIGRVSDIFGRAKLYTIGFVIFTLGSLLTGISQNPTELIGFRIVQGLGSALIWVNSIAMVTDAVPAKELGFFLGINSIGFRLGSILGLTLSGLILLFFDWRFLFYINIPIGIFGTIWAHRKLRDVGEAEKGAPLDWLGFGTFTISLTSLLLALTYAAYGVQTLTAVNILLGSTVICFLIFVMQERRSAYPMLELSIFRIQAFRGSLINFMISLMATSGLLTLLSFYFQVLLGMRAFDAGMRLLPVAIPLFAAAPVSGKLSDRFGQVPFILGGLGGSSVAMYLFSTIDTSTPYLYLALYMILLGLSNGFFLSPNTSWGMSSVPPQRRGIASSLRGTFWNVGATVSLNLVILVMSLTMPYAVISSVISSLNGASITSVDRLLFMNGLKFTFLLLALINTVAIIPTLYEWRKTKNSIVS